MERGKEEAGHVEGGHHLHLYENFTVWSTVYALELTMQTLGSHWSSLFASQHLPTHHEIEPTPRRSCNHTGVLHSRPAETSIQDILRGRGGETDNHGLSTKARATVEFRGGALCGRQCTDGQEHDFPSRRIWRLWAVARQGSDIQSQN